METITTTGTRTGTVNPVKKKVRPTKTQMIRVRVTPSQFARLLDAADKAGVSVSDYVRSRCIKI
jgi:uncharacterized protein (DUF1778 family)